MAEIGAFQCGLDRPIGVPVRRPVLLRQDIPVGQFGEESIGLEHGEERRRALLELQFLNPVHWVVLYILPLNCLRKHGSHGAQISIDGARSHVAEP